MLKRFVCGFWLCWSALAGAAEPRLLTQASVVVDLAEAPAAPAIETNLPYNWDTAVGAIDGQATFTLRFDAADGDTPQAVYLLRAGNTFAVRLNGTEIDRVGAHNAYEDYSKEPRLVPIPAGLLQPHNTLQIVIDAQGGRHAGLTPVLVGDADVLQVRYVRDYRWRIGGALVIAVISGVFGALALILWLRQRNPLYILYGSGELLWALQVSDTCLIRAPLPWPWWGVVVFSAYALAPVLICKFALEVVGRHRGWLKRLSDWQLLLSVPAVALSVLGGLPWLWTVVQGLIVLQAVAVALVVVVAGLRSENLERRVLAIAVILTIAAAVRDFIVIKFGSSYGLVSWARYAWVVFAVTLAWVIAEHMRKDRLALAQVNETLARQLAAREAELQTIFDHQRADEKKNGMLEERARLMRDMHDGLGSQLAGALQLARNPSVSRSDLALELQDVLDHLKLTVDAMQETDGDIGSLLGALRYRLAPRLQAAGISLSWDVAHLPLIPAWTIQRSRDLQMILFEAFSNLVAHSGATQAHLAAACLEGEAGSRVVQVSLSDNGSGFDPDQSAATHGRGLANMRTRAAQMDAVLRVSSSPAGSRFLLILPLSASADAAGS
ncbi:MAG: ATP-binding protein [Burkholderiaceae bacterium]